MAGDKTRVVINEGRGRWAQTRRQCSRVVARCTRACEVVNTTRQVKISSRVRVKTSVHPPSTKRTWPMESTADATGVGHPLEMTRRYVGGTTSWMPSNIAGRGRAFSGRPFFLSRFELFSRPPPLMSSGLICGDSAGALLGRSPDRFAGRHIGRARHWTPLLVPDEFRVAFKYRPAARATRRTRPGRAPLSG